MRVSDAVSAYYHWEGTFVTRFPGSAASRLVLCLSLLGLSLGAAQAHIIVGGSDLLSLADVGTLAGWLEEGPLQLENIFSTNNDGTKAAVDFHAACDGKGRTFSIYSVTKDGSDYIIGGYNPQSWNSTEGWHITDALEDRTAFIFNLTTDVYQGQHAEAPLSHGIYQTYNDASSWARFGSYDIYSSQTSAMPNVATQFSYGSGTYDVNILGGTGAQGTTFTTNRLEVFTISAVPEPSIGLLLLAGIVPLGVIYRRRRRSTSVN